MTASAADVFVSYASADRKAADAVVHGLEARGLRCWVAPRDILAGESYAKAIVRAIADCRTMVVVVSRQTNASEHVPKEVERAVSAGKPVVPLRIEDTPLGPELTYFLSSRHWLDAIGGSLDRHVDRLAHSVKALLQVDGQDPAAGPTRGGVPPRPAWRRAAVVVAAALVVAGTIWGAASAGGKGAADEPTRAGSPPASADGDDGTGSGAAEPGPSPNIAASPVEAVAERGPATEPSGIAQGLDLSIWRSERKAEIGELQDRARRLSAAGGNLDDARLSAILDGLAGMLEALAPEPPDPDAVATGIAECRRQLERAIRLWQTARRHSAEALEAACGPWLADGLPRFAAVRCAGLRAQLQGLAALTGTDEFAAAVAAESAVTQTMSELQEAWRARFAEVLRADREQLRARQEQLQGEELTTWRRDLEHAVDRLAAAQSQTPPNESPNLAEAVDRALAEADAAAGRAAAARSAREAFLAAHGGIQPAELRRVAREVLEAAGDLAVVASSQFSNGEFDRASVEWENASQKLAVLAVIPARGQPPTLALELEAEDQELRSWFATSVAAAAGVRVADDGDQADVILRVEYEEDPEASGADGAAYVSKGHLAVSASWRAVAFVDPVREQVYFDLVPGKRLLGAANARREAARAALKQLRTETKASAQLIRFVKSL